MVWIPGRRVGRLVPELMPATGVAVTNTVSERFEALVAKAAEIRRQAAQPDQIVIQVGSATCEHAAGSREVFDEFRKHIEASGREDIRLRMTGCTGRCSCEPIVGVLVPGQMPVKYEHVGRDAVHEIFTQHIQQGTPVAEHILDRFAEKPAQHEILLCGSARCGWRGGEAFPDVLAQKLQAAGLGAEQVRVTPASCFGVCATEEAGQYSHLLIRPDKVLYRVKDEKDLDELIREHLVGGRVVPSLLIPGKTIGRKFFEIYGDVAFFNRQTRVALRHNGVIHPEAIEDYFHYRGFEALAKVLQRGEPSWVVEQVSRSKLRGRGGGGYPTGKKWAMGAAAKQKERYLICNADEGDPARSWTAACSSRTR